MAAVRRSSARIQALASDVGAGSQPLEEAIKATDKPKGTKTRKRKAEAPPAEAPQESKYWRAGSSTPASGVAAGFQQSPPAAPVPEEKDSFVPSILSFDFEEAKKHLTTLDNRFEDLFTKMKCKPFENLEQMHPFR